MRSELDAHRSWPIDAPRTRRPTPMLPVRARRSPRSVRSNAPASRVDHPHWLDLRVYNEAGEPEPLLQCNIQFADGRTLSRRTNVSGCVYIDDVGTPSEYQVSFPEIPAQIVAVGRTHNVTEVTLPRHVETQLSLEVLSPDANRRQFVSHRPNATQTNWGDVIEYKAQVEPPTAGIIVAWLFSDSSSRFGPDPDSFDWADGTAGFFQTNRDDDLVQSIETTTDEDGIASINFRVDARSCDAYRVQASVATSTESITFPTVEVWRKFTVNMYGMQTPDGSGRFDLDLEAVATAYEALNIELNLRRRDDHVPHRRLIRMAPSSITIQPDERPTSVIDEVDRHIDDPWQANGLGIVDPYDLSSAAPELNLIMVDTIFNVLQKTDELAVTQTPQFVTGLPYFDADENPRYVAEQWSNADHTWIPADDNVRIEARQMDDGQMSLALSLADSGHDDPLTIGSTPGITTVRIIYLCQMPHAAGLAYESLSSCLIAAGDLVVTNQERANAEHAETAIHEIAHVLGLRPRHPMEDDHPHCSTSGCLMRPEADFERRDEFCFECKSELFSMDYSSGLPGRRPR